MVESRTLDKALYILAGLLVLGGLASLLRRGAVFILLGALVYALGGWTAIATFWKSLFFVK